MNHMRQVLIVYQYGNSAALHATKDAFRKAGMRVRSINRTKINGSTVKDSDLIVCVGGDGTFIRTSHFIRSAVPILGLNADPKKKVGFFTRTDASSIADDALRLRKMDFTLRRLTRLKCVLQGRELPFLSLNEFFLSHAVPYKLSKYILEGEVQRSSGILVGTASGSNAWIRSAGGKVLPLESKRFQFLVREPYDGVGDSATRINGVLGKDESISVTSLMKNGIIVVDCLSKPYRMGCNEKAVFSVSVHHLNMVDFSSR